MSWGSAFKQRTVQAAAAEVRGPHLMSVPMAKINLAKVVTVDFETYFDGDYTLRKLNTSTYVRHEQFKAHMAGIKIGNRPTKVYSGAKLEAALKAIDWSTHALLCHNTAFDGLILSHHFGVVPHLYLDTLSMARGLHGNDIGASLDEVAHYYGVGNKIPNVLGTSKGVRDLDKATYASMASYCAEDVRLTFEIFKQMLACFPAKELRLVHHTVSMFCDPILKVDLPRVATELAREIKAKEDLLISVSGIESDLEQARKVIASNESFAQLLIAEGVAPPTKISPTTKKQVYAFAKTDLDFTSLSEHPSERVRNLVDARLAVKSTIGETRAERFLEAGKNGWSLPVLLNYYGAHTGRWSAGNKMNMQNLPRGGELRLSILAPRGNRLVVADSGQIEARVNAWISEQDDLLAAFAAQSKDSPTDVYTKFASTIYGREITKADTLERFIGKIAVLGLGYSMGAPKLQATLALGTMGPAVFLELDLCKKIVNLYRRMNFKIAAFWKRCEAIIDDMITGTEGSYKCLRWEKECIWLPNGMRLKYPGLRCDIGDNGFKEYTYQRKGITTKIYGGLLCENIVQALARIVIGEQLLELADGYKYRIVTTTHDELVACVKTPQAKKCFKDMWKVMTTPPDWCSDLPLSAEGGWAENYSK
jgi:DNA polymerase